MLAAKGLSALLTVEKGALSWISILPHLKMDGNVSKFPIHRWRRSSAPSVGGACTLVLQLRTESEVCFRRTQDKPIQIVALSLACRTFGDLSCDRRGDYVHGVRRERLIRKFANRPLAMKVQGLRGIAGGVVTIGSHLLLSRQVAEESIAINPARRRARRTLPGWKYDEILVKRAELVPNGRLQWFLIAHM